MRRGALAIAVALAVLAVACDDSSDGRSAEESTGKPVSREVVTVAAGRTASEASAAIDGEVTVSVGGTAVTTIIEGAADFQTGAGVVTLTFQVDEGPPQGNRETGAVEIRSIDRATAFANLGDFLDGPSGMPWVSFTAADLGTASQSLTVADPQVALDFLQAVVGRPVEGETFDGFPGDDVTPYDVELDLEQLLDPSVAGTLDPSTEAEVRRIVDLVHRPVNGQVFLDPEGRVTQFQYSFVIEIEGETLETKFRLTFRDFGTAVTVTPPPPEQVQPYSAVADEFEQLRLGEGAVPAATE